jgi:iron complex outermembrane receptor protein
VALPADHTTITRFDIAAGDAAAALEQFTKQSGQDLLYSADAVAGVVTNAVSGRFAPKEALGRLLAGTVLRCEKARSSEAMAIVRTPKNTGDSRNRDPKPMKHSNPFKRALTALLFSAGAGSMQAQTSPGASAPEKEEPVVLPAFTVSSETADRYRANDSISAVRIRTSLLETPSSISVLTREFIDDVSPVRIYDATRYIAGVQESRGITFGDRQIIRGFESEGRTVDNFLDSTAPNFEEALIDRIEVSKGPNAILAPGGVPGGAINVVTKSPQFAPQRSITALVGTFDAQKVTLDLTDKVGGQDNMAYRFIGSYQDTGRYWSSDAKIKRKLVAPQFTWRLGRNTELTLKYYYLDAFVFREPALILDPSVGPDSEPILGPGFKAKSLNGIQPWSGISTDTHVAQFQFTTTLNDRLTTRFAGRGMYFGEDSEQEFFTTPGFSNRYNPTTGELTQDYTWALDPITGQYVSTFSRYYDPANIPVRGEKADVIIRNYALQNDWVFTARTSAANFQTVAGWAYSYSDATDQRVNGTLPAINLLAPAVAAYPVWGTAFIRDAHSDNTNWQAYLNQRIDFFKDRVAVNVGYLHYDTNTQAIDRATTAPRSRLDDSKDMYLGSVLAKVTANASLYYSYSTNATPTIVNNAPLWRDGKQHEFGGKWELFGGKLSLAAAYFEIAQTNVSVPNPERAVNPSAPTSLLADYENHGAELEVTGAITRNLSVIASISQLKLRDALDRRVRSVADNLASILLNYRFLDGALKGLSINAGASYTGERAGDATATNFTPLNVPTQISFYIPSYTVYNAGASYSWDRYQIRLYVDNLTNDKDYVQQAGARISGPGLATATGMNVRFSATLKF